MLERVFFHSLDVLLFLRQFYLVRYCILNTAYAGAVRMVDSPRQVLFFQRPRWDWLQVWSLSLLVRLIVIWLHEKVWRGSVEVRILQIIQLLHIIIITFVIIFRTAQRALALLLPTLRHLTRTKNWEWGVRITVCAGESFYWGLSFIEIFLGVETFNHMPSDSRRLVVCLRISYHNIMICLHHFDKFTLVFFELRLLEIDLYNVSPASSFILTFWAVISIW